MSGRVYFEGCSAEGELWAVGDAEAMWDLIALLRARGFRIGLAEADGAPTQHSDLLLVPGHANNGILVACCPRTHDALRAAASELQSREIEAEMARNEIIRAHMEQTGEIPQIIKAGIAPPRGDLS